MKADPTTEAEVWSLCERMIEAYGARDARAYMSFWAPDEDIVYIGSGPDEIGFGRGPIEAINQRTISEPESMSVVSRWHVISREGPVSWVTGESDVRVVVEGDEFQFRFRATFIFVLRDDKWLMVNAHYSVPDRDIVEGRSWPSSLDAVTSAVGLEQPDLRASAAPDGTVTLLFSDIEESTEITERLGDLQWMDVLREHNAIVRERVVAHGGFEVKTIGDAFMVAFQSARRALTCSVDIQRAFAAYSRENPDRAVRIRVGLHAGEPVREGDDFYGKSVIVASRIAGQARGGEILVSSLLKDLVESAGDIKFGEMRQTELKGFSQPHTVFPVAWEL
jgi:class 3 adenylate cyclase/ketosteroid isomerase-like protein